jgi:predicted TPR repeat methyltransferase
MDPIEALLLRDSNEPWSIEEAMRVATALHRNSQLDAAKELYRLVLASVPEHPDALHFLGLLAYDQGQSEEAIRLMSRSIELVPNHASFHNNLGNLMLDNERFEDAERAYRRALDLEPDRPDTLNNYGVLCKELGRPAEAERCLLRVIELVPDFIDARINLANLYTRQGRIQEALAQNAEALKLRPNDPRSRQMRGHVLVRLGRLAEAAEIFRDWLAAEPDNPRAQHYLAACTGEAVPARASDAYVRTLFDSFSQSFDARLAKLAYRAPALIGETVAACLGEARADLAVLDAGCGTGLCAQHLRPYAARLHGVDLSPGMLTKARARNLYDELHEAELTAYMAGRAGDYDLVVSADTLVYFGALEVARGAAAVALRPGGHLCFTVEALGDDATDGYRLQPHGRYAHARDYLEEALSRAGLELLKLEGECLRQEAGEPVAGWLVLARKAEGLGLG